MNSQMEQVEVLVTAPERLPQLLADAEEALIAASFPQRNAGILITRHNHHRYTVALSDRVPYGETREYSAL